MTKTLKIPISERAIIQRINRALKRGDEVLKATRGTRALIDLGHFYILDVNRNFVRDKEVHLESLAKELHVLKPFEEIVYRERA